MKKIVIFFICFLFISGCSLEKTNEKDSLKEDKTSNTFNISSGTISESLDDQTGYLNLSNNGYEQIPNLCNISTGYVKKIKILDLSSNSITKANKDFSCLPNLKSVNISYNDLSEFITLGDLGNLNTLKLHKNNLKNIDSLKEYSNIKNLNLGYNSIKNIGVLSSFGNLLSLELQRNNIEDISPLKKLKSIEKLKLEYNNISNPNQLNNLKNMKNLEYVSVKGNNLNKNIIDSLSNWSEK